MNIQTQFAGVEVTIGVERSAGYEGATDGDVRNAVEEVEA